MVGKSDVNMGTLATLEEAFPLASSKFKFADLDSPKTVAEKDDIFPGISSSDTSVICHVFMHCLGSFLLQDMF